MKFLRFAFLSLLLINCSQNSKDVISNINGYWEIEKVVLENGETKVFSINQTIDYFSVNDSLKGFRKKLNPQVDCSYNHSNDAEAIQICFDNDNWIIKYTTPYAEWEEIIKELSEDTIELLNQDNRLYIYKRYIPISITP